MDETMVELIYKCLKDSKFKEDFKKDPKAVIARDYNIQIPDDLTIQVLEDTQTIHHIVIPFLSKEELGVLSEEELQGIAGGQKAWDSQGRRLYFDSKGRPISAEEYARLP